LSAITQLARDKAIRELDYLKGKLEAYGLDPKWASAAMTNAANNPALTYAIEKTAIQAAVTDLDSTFSTWCT
jgi:hypothetical protein